MLQGRKNIDYRRRREEKILSFSTPLRGSIVLIERKDSPPSKIDGHTLFILLGRKNHL